MDVEIPAGDAPEAVNEEIVDKVVDSVDNEEMVEAPVVGKQDAPPMSDMTEGCPDCFRVGEGEFCGTCNVMRPIA